jgi:hypothetical protein
MELQWLFPMLIPHDSKVQCKAGCNCQRVLIVRHSGTALGLSMHDIECDLIGVEKMGQKRATLMKGTHGNTLCT